MMLQVTAGCGKEKMSANPEAAGQKVFVSTAKESEQVKMLLVSAENRLFSYNTQSGDMKTILLWDESNIVSANIKRICFIEDDKFRAQLYMKENK